MAAVPARIAQRLSSGLKRFQPVISSARARDVNESDTVTIVTDILAELFGYDKYSEITSEHAIRGTYCDIVIKLDGALKAIIEVKAIGIDFRATHTKQAVDYAANQGVEWVILTNGMIWQIYRVVFAKPIDQQLVYQMNLLDLNPRTNGDVEALYLLTREGMQKQALDAHYARRQATDRFMMGAVLQSDTIVGALRRELRRLTPDVSISVDEVRQALVNEVLKRDVVEGEEAQEACRRVNRTLAKCARSGRSAKAAREQAENPQEPALDCECGDSPE